MGEWIRMTLSEAPGEPSVRRQAYALTVVCALIICFLGIFFDIPTNVVTLMIAILTLTAGGVTAGRFAENKE